MKQTEITVQVFESFLDVKSKLISQGFIIGESFLLDDEYYSKYTLSQAKKLKYSKLIATSILLRQIVGHQTTNWLIYKNKKISNRGVVLSEEKYKTQVSSKQKSEQILTKSGLVCYCKLKQHCHVFIKNDISILVQIVDNLGVFIEAEETDKMQNLSSLQKINELKNQVYCLGLQLGKDMSCKKPYMLLHKKQ